MVSQGRGVAARPFADGRLTMVLVRGSLALDGAAKASRWLSRLQAFDAAGWATHAVLIDDDDDLLGTADSLRARGSLPEGTAVHHFAMRDRRVRASWWPTIRPGEPPEPIDALVGDWLGWLIGHIPGAVLVTDAPDCYPYLAQTPSPLVARVAEIPSGPVATEPADLAPIPAVVAASDGPLARFDAVVVATEAEAQALQTTFDPGTRVLVIPPGAPAGAPASPAGSAEDELDPAGWAPWIQLAEELSDRVCDRRTPSLLLESMGTTSRVLRARGILASSEAQLADWVCRLEGLANPAGWLSGARARQDDDENVPEELHTIGSTRDVVCQLRSNALAFVAKRNGPFRIDFSDGAASVPMMSTGFEPRIIVSKVGSATLVSRVDGTVWVTPREEIVRAEADDGSFVARIEDGPTSDVTYAVNWVLDVDWASGRHSRGARTFPGTLRGSITAPAEGSLPAICVTDVAGYSRPVGALRPAAVMSVDGLAWSLPVHVVLRADPVVATTALVDEQLALHLGYANFLEPIHELRAKGALPPQLLYSRRGSATLLPAPDRSVVVAPGTRYRALAGNVVRRTGLRG